MSGLTDEQIHEVFAAFDEDGSGKLSMTELNNALCLLGIDLTDEELTDTYHIDDDPDSLTEEEFAMYIRDRIGDVDFKQRCEECLREFVEDESGLLSRAQLKIILTQRGSHPMSDEDAEAIMDEFDEDGNGSFDVEELSKLMYSPQEQQQQQQQQGEEEQPTEEA